MKSLIILTSRFPFPPGEEFLTNEIEELSKTFGEIKILPTSSDLVADPEKRKSLPSNVKVFIPSQKGKGRIWRLLRLLGDFQAIGWLINELPEASSYGLKGILKLLNWTTFASEIKRQIKVQKFSGEDIYYSYWLTPSATALAMLKDGREISTAVSRVHGGDLYQERHQPAYLPYQRRVLARLDQTYSISSNGKEYLTKLHHISDSKISISRLGTRNINPFKPAEDKTDKLRIITCSYLKPVKRLHLLAEALKNVEVPVEWTHIGDGPERKKIEELIKEAPENISVKFLGNLNNKEVLRNYEENRYDLFINVSESEGIPVTIMEAFSFGIPVIATNVGGTSELVNEGNGYLLPKEFQTRKLAELMEEFYRLSLEARNAKALKAYETWDEQYNASKNYQKFAKQLTGASER